jgi:hypothetical protein
MEHTDNTVLLKIKSLTELKFRLTPFKNLHLRELSIKFKKLLEPLFLEIWMPTKI